MARKKEDDAPFFGGFEAVVDGLARAGNTSKSVSGTYGGGDEVVDMTKKSVFQNKEDAVVEPPYEEEQVEPEEIEEPVVEPEEEEEEEEIVETPEKEESTEPVSELSEYEEDIVNFFSEKLGNELGWEFEEDAKPKSVEDIINYMSAIVEENSKPDFASEDIEKLNEYIKNGGDFKKFMSEIHGGTNYENIDISSDKNQKKVITENFLRLGYSDEKIQKALDRYEESGTLEEEAEEALDLLKEHSSKRAEQLLVEQENTQKEYKKQQQKFYQDVQTTVGQLDSIRGIPMSAKEKRELLDYIFKPEADGRTKYQKDYAKDYKNLIESAYFTMRGDSLLSKVANKATSQAARVLQDKLASKGRRTKNSGGVVGTQNTLSAWDAVSNQLRRPKF